MKRTMALALLVLVAGGAYGCGSDDQPSVGLIRDYVRSAEQICSERDGVLEYTTIPGSLADIVVCGDRSIHAVTPY